MSKKGKKEKKDARLTRKQRKAAERSYSVSLDPEDLNGQLRSLGLCTKNITGDGNCLFRSLSDQYYGHDGKHKQIRQEICQYLKDNEETYKFFVEDDQSFDSHISSMTQNGTFGGNMELVAFAKLKQIDIKVYQPGMIYVINGKDDDEDNNNISEGEEVAIRQHILHIAYHSWEHYDSVRNIDRPHTGLPEIKTSLSEHKETASDEAERGEDEEEYKNMSSVEKVVRNACPDISIYKIRRLLVKYKGNPDKVIDAIYELENNKIGKDIAIETSKEDKSLTADREEDETTVTKTEQFKTADLDQEKVDKTDISISTNKVNDMKLEFEIIESTTSALTKDILPEQILADQQQQNSTEIIVEGAEKEAEKQKQEGDKKGGSQAGTKDENHLEQNAAKKPSASERKREKKKKQKEQKLLKERAKAARKAQYTKKKEEIDSVLADSVNDNTSQVKTTAMKVVSI